MESVSSAATDPPAVTWTGGPRTWFTCTGCKRAKLDPSGGSAQSSDGQTLCRDCNGERIARHWDGRPSGVYGVAVNGEPAGAVRHVQAEPHAFTEDGADRTHCGATHGAGKCGRLASSPIHQGGNGGGGDSAPDATSDGPGRWTSWACPEHGETSVDEEGVRRWSVETTADGVTRCLRVGCYRTSADRGDNAPYPGGEA